LLSLHRQTGDAPWTATPLTAAAKLALPALGLDIPVAAFYEDVDFGA
jgi:hypothetical protein